MIDEAVWAEIRRLVLGEGWAIGTVARHLCVHRSVVERALREAGPVRAPRPPPSDVLGPFKPYIAEQLKLYPALSAVRLFHQVQERGYANGIAQVKRYVLAVRGPRLRKAYLSVEYEPAEQAQVDWGSFGFLRMGRTQRPLSCFVMVLSWSRAMFLDFAPDQRMDTFCRMHRRALEFFGGVPRTILYDNLKSVVLHHVGATVQYNPTFLAFAGQYLFEPKAAPPYYPQSKGRVEGTVRYIRQSFFYGRSFKDLSDLREQAAAWRDQVANSRKHAVTRERPIDRLLVERLRLRPLPPHPVDTDLVLCAIVSKHARVTLDTNHYSVPLSLVGQPVVLRASDVEVRVLHQGQVVATHPRSWDRRTLIEKEEHITPLTETKPASRGSRSRSRIAALSDEARLYLREIARRRISLPGELDRLSRYLDQYGPDEVTAALAKALGQRTFGAHYVKALMDQARFAAGLPEPPEPIVTGNSAADSVTVTTHALETYDAYFLQQSTQLAQQTTAPLGAPPPDAVPPDAVDDVPGSGTESPRPRARRLPTRRSPL